MAKVKYNKDYKNYSVSIIQGDVLTTYPVVDVIGDSVEYEEGVLNIADATKYIDNNTGGLHYIFNLDLPAVVEAKNLKLLRRSTAVNNLFKYDKGKKFDLVAFMPWVVIIALVIF